MSGLSSDDSALISRKVRIPGRVTSVRLEGALWDAYHDICRALGWSRHSLASRIDRDRDPSLGLTNAMRVFIVVYWRLSAADREANAMALLTRALAVINQPGQGISPTRH